MSWSMTRAQDDMMFSKVANKGRNLKSKGQSYQVGQVHRIMQAMQTGLEARLRYSQMLFSLMF